MPFSSTLLEHLRLDEKCRRVISPATDVLESPEAYTLHCVMPGVDKDDIRLDLADGKLFIEAQAKLDPPPGMHVHSLEFYSSLYRISLVLPGDALNADVSAEYSDGVLTLTLPRRKQSLVRRVDVKTS